MRGECAGSARGAGSAARAVSHLPTYFTIKILSIQAIVIMMIYDI